jgi:hypothetical protein
VVAPVLQEVMASRERGYTMRVQSGAGAAAAAAGADAQEEERERERELGLLRARWGLYKSTNAI